MGSLICESCGYAPTVAATFCRRCGHRLGASPATATGQTPWRECFVCYRMAGADGLFDGSSARADRHTFDEHLATHAAAPLGDEEYLESLRVNDQMRVGRWNAPFDAVRRYLVTGMFVSDRRRMAEHNALVMAMIRTHHEPTGNDGPLYAEWREARQAVEAVMDRFHRGYR